jgi:hypothetical protein
VSLQARWQAASSSLLLAVVAILVFVFDGEGLRGRTLKPNKRQKRSSGTSVFAFLHARTRLIQFKSKTVDIIYFNKFLFVPFWQFSFLKSILLLKDLTRIARTV